MSFFRTKDAAKSVLSETPPPGGFDGFGFFRDKNDDEVKFYFFDDLVKQYGPSPKDPTVPDDRETYHVILTSVRRGITHIEPPFTAHFLDPFVYAKHVAYSGFTGIMIRQAKWSAVLLRDCLLEIMLHHAKNLGFFYAHDGGPEVFFKGTKDLPT